MPWWKDASSFRQPLNDWLESNPGVVPGEVAYDDRGALFEPHTGRKVPIGTRQVNSYVDLFTGVEERETIGPQSRYSAILFCEKEGFNQLFASVKLRERFDIATVSTKGQSNRSLRQLVDKLAAYDVPIFTLTDFDKSGIEIRNVIASTGNNYHEYQNSPEVIHIGLTLQQGQSMGLEGEDVDYKNIKNDPRPALLQKGATPEEAEFLFGTGYPWMGKRIELNEIPAPKLIEMIENALETHGVKKVVPAEDVLDKHFSELAFEALVDERLQEARKRIESDTRKDLVDASFKAPEKLYDAVVEQITGTDIPWDKQLETMAKEAVQSI